MRHLGLLSLSIAAFALVGCDDNTVTPGEDAGPESMDAATPDAGGSDDGGTPSVDAAMDPDGGPIECRDGQHRCGDACVDLMPNDPTNGCALGCGDPCPVADAICNPDGTCGMEGCEPMTCESLSVECGIIDNGCGDRRSCGSCDVGAGQTCQDGACVVVCAADPREANDTRATATNLGSLEEDATPIVVANATMHSDTDTDWYRLDAVNLCCGGDPIMKITLDGIPVGEDYDLVVYHQCPDGSTPTCDSGTTVSMGGLTGCRSAGTGATEYVEYHTRCDDGGTAYAQVYSFDWSGSCDTYRLELEVE